MRGEPNVRQGEGRGHGGWVRNGMTYEREGGRKGEDPEVAARCSSSW